MRWSRLICEIVMYIISIQVLQKLKIKTYLFFTVLVFLFISAVLIPGKIVAVDCTDGGQAQLCFGNGCPTGCFCDGYPNNSGTSGACAPTPVGGCFPPGTIVRSSTGGKKIEDVKVGDSVTSFDDQSGKILQSKVTDLHEVHRTFYFSIIAGGYHVTVTAEHPFYIGGGQYKEAQYLKTGDVVYVDENNSLVYKVVADNIKINEPTPAYNLTVDNTHTFFANDFAVHNKGGPGREPCPAGTHADFTNSYLTCTPPDPLGDWDRATGNCCKYVHNEDFCRPYNAEIEVGSCVPDCDPNAWGACSTSCGAGTQTNACGTARGCNLYQCAPVGSHESSSCVASTGWACDADNYNTALSVSFYTNGSLLGSATANQDRPDIAAQCGGSSPHGFSFGTPYNLWTGTPYSISAYTSNTPSGPTSLLSGSPKTITCNPLPWWQVKDGDVQSAGDLASQVAYGKTFDLDGPGGFPGIPAYGGSTNITPPVIISSTSWIAGSAPVGAKVYNYDYFANMIPADVTVNPMGPTFDINSGVADTNGYYWYKYDGAVNSGQPLTIPATDIGIKKVILMVDNADLNITGNINLTKGAGVFMVIVKGSINVDSAVGGTGPNLEGLYLADNLFSDGVGATQLWLRGSLVANGGVSLQRDLGGVANLTPAELFEFAPDQIMLFPKVLGTRKINWKEVAP